MSIDLDIAQTLEDAADLIERHGHLRFHLTNETGAYCAAGAFNKALTGNPYYGGLTVEQEDVREAAFAAVAAHLRLQLRIVDPWREGAMNAVVTWNNQDGRTGAEVIDVFRLVAKDIRNTAKPE